MNSNYPLCVLTARGASIYTYYSLGEEVTNNNYYTDDYRKFFYSFFIFLQKIKIKEQYKASEGTKMFFTVKR